MNDFGDKKLLGMVVITEKPKELFFFLFFGFQFPKFSSSTLTTDPSNFLSPMVKISKIMIYKIKYRHMCFYSECKMKIDKHKSGKFEDFVDLMTF